MLKCPNWLKTWLLKHFIFPKTRVHSGSNGIHTVFLPLTKAAQFEFLKSMHFSYSPFRMHNNIIITNRERMSKKRKGVNFSRQLFKHNLNNRLPLNYYGLDWTCVMTRYVWEYIFIGQWNHNKKYQNCKY